MPEASPSGPPSKPGLLKRALERYRWISRRNKIAIWCLLVVIAALVVSVRWIQPAYRTTKMWLFINMAEKAVAAKDYNAASIAYRKALLSGYEKPDAWKSLAKFLEAVESAEVINVWMRLAKMLPNERKYSYYAVRDALKFNRPYQAEEILGQLPKSWHDDPEFLRLQAKLYTEKKFYPEAEQALQKLVALSPDDPKAAFDLVTVRTQLADPATRQKAYDELLQTAKGSSAFASAALRSAIAAEQRAENFYEADRLASLLVQRPDATLEDRLNHAQLEAKTESFSLAVTQANLRKYAEQHPETFPAIMQWMVSSRIDLPATALWVKALPASVKSSAEAQAALYQYYLTIGEWEQVYQTLRNPDSTVYVAPKVLDLAKKAIDEDRSGQTSAERTWMQAVYAAEGKAATLRILGLLASGRGWTAATGRALSALAEASPGDPSVWVLLVQHENSVRNLAGLYTALQGLMRLNPYDINVASNWVLAAAMVRPGDLEEILDIAKRTYYSTYPSDPRAATAYAMALLRVGRTKEAGEIVDKMSIVDRREPQRAIYVGSVLAAAGRRDEALEYFKRSEDLVDDPFPEEITLRRIWKGVALGEATTAEEAAQMLLKREDIDVEAGKINAQLRTEMKRRVNPEETQRIFQSLRSQTEGRKESPVEVEELIRQIRGDQKP